MIDIPKAKKEKFIQERTAGIYVVEIRWTQDHRRMRKYIGTYKASDYQGKPALALKAAKAARDRALVDAEMERLSDRRVTVDDLFRKSLERCASLKTRQRHEQMYDALVPEELQGRPIEKVTVRDIQDTVDTFARSHSDDAIVRTPTIWRQIYREAMRAEIYVPDRSQAIVIPKSKTPAQVRERTCSTEQLEQFLACLLTYNAASRKGVAIALDLWAAIRIMQFCGLRPQEALALSCDDIDLQGMTIHVRRSVGSTATQTRQLIPLKTSASRRDIPIPAELVSVLTAHIRLRKGSGLLFRHPDDGLPYEIDYLGQYMTRVSRKAGVKVTLYMLRHMFASDVRKVTDPRTLQALMGHETAVMSLRYADSPDPAELVEALRKRQMS